ncbi:MAG: dihydrofolate reductase [Bacteroidales bacterium]|jgi:dihydrofolate reductase|nr:dihydrofolate reductase [Bacteroidales bacterium]
MVYDNLSIIVAVGKNNEIGRHNQLLVHLPNDMKRFKQLTLDTTVLMGENTYHSLPVKPLPKRRNIVLSFDKEQQFSGCEMAYSIDEALEMIKEDKTVFIMGGASIYKQFLSLVSKLYLTKIDMAFLDADAFFPEIDFSQWKQIEEINCNADEKHLYNYTYCTYNRIIKS